MKNPLPTAVTCGLLLIAVNASAQSTNFVLACSPSVPAGPNCVAVADVNGDGKPDLICSSTISSGILGALTILTNDGTGAFNSNATLFVDGSAPSVIAMDVNGDQKPDLICPVIGGQSKLVIFTNNGSGVFGSNSTIYYAGSVIPADVNADGKPDLIVADGSAIEILTNNGHGSFGLNATLNNYFDGSLLVSGDLNGDLRPDLICGYLLDPGRFEVFMNNGSGTLTSNLVFTAGYSDSYDAASILLADVNGDGKPDFVCFDSLAKTLDVLTNNGGGIFGIYSNSVPNIVTNSSWIAAADLNQDRKVDLINADPIASTLTVFTNAGSGFFGSNATLNVGTKPVFVVAADVNGDGKPDLITVNQTDNTLTVLTNATVIPVPPLTIVQVGNQSAVFWPVTPWNYVLQTTTNLASSNWTTVTDGTQNICITVTNTSPAAFYRLQAQ